MFGDLEYSKNLFGCCKSYCMKTINKPWKTETDKIKKKNHDPQT